MSHLTEQQNYVCPNCDHVADGNYCAQCGQETHLHKDTFWGLLSHFVAHYFHYDSKFWKTLKTLLFRPGKLTVEYREKHRMRYIPPVSLYIFVSVVFFLIFPFTPSSKSFGVNQQSTLGGGQDSVRAAYIQDSVQQALAKQGIQYTPDAQKKRSKLIQYIKQKGRAIDKSPEEFNAMLLHSFPKVFFFMIPVLALFLKICFLRNKNYYYVDHAVFSLHIQSFAFILMLLNILNPFDSIDGYMYLFIFLSGIIYFLLALRKVYHTRWLRSVLIFLFTSLGYVLFLGFFMLADFLIVLSLQ